MKRATDSSWVPMALVGVGSFSAGVVAAVLVMQQVALAEPQATKTKNAPKKAPTKKVENAIEIVQPNVPADGTIASTKLPRVKTLLLFNDTARQIAGVSDVVAIDIEKGEIYKDEQTDLRAHVAQLARAVAALARKIDRGER